MNCRHSAQRSHGFGISYTITNNNEFCNQILLITERNCALNKKLFQKNLPL